MHNDMGTWSSREDIAHNVAMSWDESDVDNTEKLAGDIQTLNGGIKVSRSV